MGLNIIDERNNVIGQYFQSNDWLTSFLKFEFFIPLLLYLSQDISFLIHEIHSLCEWN